MDSTSDSITLGQRRADDIIARRKVGMARRAAALAAHPATFELSMQVASTSGPVATTRLQTAGFLVAAGDSWFDYPFHDVLKLLEDNYGYNVESAAHRGDPIEACGLVPSPLLPEPPPPEVRVIPSVISAANAKSDLLASTNCCSLACSAAAMSSDFKVRKTR